MNFLERTVQSLKRSDMTPSKNLQSTTYRFSPKKLQAKKLLLGGFTLIELLVVVGIIGVVTGIVMSSINSAKAKGRDAKRIADISVIQLALERYYDQYHKYPTSLTIFSTDSSVPTKDPSGNNYSYKALNNNNTAACSDTDCQSYHLGATLELYSGILTDDDIDLISGVSGDFSGADTAGCGGGTGKCYDAVPKF